MSNLPRFVEPGERVDRGAELLYLRTHDKVSESSDEASDKDAVAVAVGDGDEIITEEIRGLLKKHPRAEIREQRFVDGDGVWDVDIKKINGRVEPDPDNPDAGILSDGEDSVDQHDDSILISTRDGVTAGRAAKSSTTVGSSDHLLQRPTLLLTKIYVQPSDYSSNFSSMMVAPKDSFSYRLRNSTSSQVVEDQLQRARGIQRPRRSVPPHQTHFLNDVTEATEHKKSNTVVTVPSFALNTEVDQDNVEKQPRLLAFQRDCDNDSNVHWFSIYEKNRNVHAFMKGFPVMEARSDICALWNPLSPLIELSTRDFVCRPTTIGDIGFLDITGRFKTFFNIFLSMEENHRLELSPPASFQHVNGIFGYLLRDHDFLRRSFLSNRPRVGDQKNKSAQDGIDSYTITFDPVFTDASYMILPEGGELRGLDADVFRDHLVPYFSAYASSWYRHIKQFHKGLNNGGLYLITSELHAPIWGMSATKQFFTGKKKKETLIYHQDGPDTLHYLWDGTYSRFNTCTGPNYNDLRDTRLKAKREYCVAVSPSSLWLDEKVWDTHFPQEKSQGYLPSTQPNIAPPVPLEVISPTSSSRSSSKKSLKKMAESVKSTVSSLFSSGDSAVKTKDIPVPAWDYLVKGAAPLYSSDR